MASTSTFTGASTARRSVMDRRASPTRARRSQLRASTTSSRSSTDNRHPPPTARPRRTASSVFSIGRRSLREDATIGNCRLLHPRHPLPPRGSTTSDNPRNARTSRCSAKKPDAIGFIQGLTRERGRLHASSSPPSTSWSRISAPERGRRTRWTIRARRTMPGRSSSMIGSELIDFLPTPARQAHLHPDR